jgi:spoIIIJ-associated protein
MKKIEASTLEGAYAQAAAEFNCSVTQLQVEIIQFPTSGFLGLFKKSAIIVAAPLNATQPPERAPSADVKTNEEVFITPVEAEVSVVPEVDETDFDEKNEELFSVPEDDEEEEFYDDGLEIAYDEMPIDDCATDVQSRINELFSHACFELNEIHVSVYDEHTLLVEISGADCALMIGKEGYRYKALSYMLFNWINATYGLQLRLEIAEFLKNQEESIDRYLVGVYESVDRDGRSQTKVLDGVLVQIALTQLRSRYPDRYVAIRTTRDGGKFIIINSYHEF